MQDIFIFIDNKPALKALSSANTKSKVFSRCRRELMIITEQCNITHRWISGLKDINAIMTLKKIKIWSQS